MLGPRGVPAALAFSLASVACVSAPELMSVLHRVFFLLTPGLPACFHRADSSTGRVPSVLASLLQGVAGQRTQGLRVSFTFKDAAERMSAARPAAVL